MKGIACLAALVLFMACSNIEVPNTNLPKAIATTGNIAPEPFNEYWYVGEAEVNSYDLQQARYGETRLGDAVLVFVTEPFSKSKQVKLDYPQADKDQISVMKMNALRRFDTGIYDYAIMSSVFTPVQFNQFPSTLKANMSSQEWCGQTYTQFNLDKNQYRVSGFSYFESEGDKDKKMDAVLLEDELFNRIRLQPAHLPIGNIDLIPSMTYSRLKHKPLRVTKARASIRNIEHGKQYKVEYMHFDRTITIEFEAEFPHKILAWTETDAGQRTTATLKKSLQTDYWTKNTNQYVGMRHELGLRK